ncbi:2-amino-4-hydroxy-6-hydroxymethyldihydropteridine diphosphokinase [Niveibacterium umoris]|uniref:2-amino-4-hydroxy-6-hydroxymethyldihydropteridine pyrophosphokinase n=1 Tax=Niveibacterium umoris TaxID=1193620 RepID=A0A840BGS1_9RHOO|nr:2-amino-4-hydroxy-6-hydroxymethyldihydropteridine diphosphokinase [Niveibacterium umoris]MBB4011863.1 2-amino-4-hydroxy-6-hydroxymethyldihydropteridine diphosphokinase [Niveibacterium umoris]
MTPLVRAWIALGANLGNPQATLDRAFESIARLPQTRLIARSSLYRTAPIDAPDQPDYWNAVAAVDTALEPLDLLHALQKIEASHGRVREFRNAPRTLDLDLLMFGGITLDADELTLPHPRMHLRAFVLAPLAEIDPDLAIPGVGRVASLLPAVRDQRIERVE